ncbi:unnamed protein product [Albugo candida]|nr:unnamed protein product [Albugo candida]|eukprot:CCI47175.1 unnamed protein product [Albugo candida]
MTRQAHAAHSCMLHYYQNQMLTIQLPFTSKEFSPKGSKRAELRELKRVEAESVKRIRNLVSSHQIRFRPSLLGPLLTISSKALGSGTLFIGEQVAKSINNGIKFAISDFCNDQIRELLEQFPGETALKEVMKQNRDEELGHVDQATQETEYKLQADPNDVDRVASSSKNATKMLLLATKSL